MNQSSLNNFTLVPVIEQDGSLSYKSFENTLLGSLSKAMDIAIPAIIKDIKISADSESYMERQWEIKSQLLELTPSSSIKPFDVSLNATYKASLITGNQKNRVVYLHEDIHERLKGIFVSPEEMLSYGKFLSTEFTCYGAHSLSGVNIQVVPDAFRDGYEYDGLGFCSKDIMEALGVHNLIQFRAVRSELKLPGVSKGLLKCDPSLGLPPNTIMFTHGCLKGAGEKDGWVGLQNLWIGVLRNYQKPGRVKDSWTWSEIPTHKYVKETEIPQAINRANELMDIIGEPAKALEYKGLLDRDEGFSMLDQVLRVAVGATIGNVLPPLTQHPYLAMGLRDLMASKLREVAVDGAISWNYLVNTATIHDKNEPRAIRTCLYPVGTEVVIRRYPIILRDSWGVVVGNSDGSQEIQMAEQVQKEVAADHDGDQIAIIECSRRLKIAKEERDNPNSVVSKNHERLMSTWWELQQTIAKNIGSSGVGTATYGLLASKISGNDKLAEELCSELQKAVDSMKWSVKADIKKCREALDEYGLPVHVAHRHDPKQFKAPETTDSFEDANWTAVVNVFKSRTEKLEILPLSAYGSIFGYDAHGLSKAKFRELVMVYRFYCAKIRSLHELKDETYRREKIGELFESLRAWASDKTGANWICAAWQLCHQQASKNNRAVFVFELWREHLITILGGIYHSQEMERVSEEFKSDIKLTEMDLKSLQVGIKKDIYPTGVPIQINPEVVSINTSKKLSSVAIVNLNGISPVELSELIKKNDVEVVASKDRFLPGFDCNGLDVVTSQGKVAEIADVDIQNFSNSVLEGEVLEFKNSLKVISLN